MAVTGTWTGQHAADLRAALRMPITEFAAYLGIAEGTVSKWERKLAAVVPTPGMQQVLDVALERAPPTVQDRFTLLCVSRRKTTGGTGDDLDADVNRRELLRLLSIGGAALALGEPLDRERIACQSGPADTGFLAEYGKVNAGMWRVYAQAVPKASVLPAVNDQLRIIIGRLRLGGPGRRQLCALASDMFQLAGEIAFDTNRYAEAAHCYTMAATAARDGEAPDLWACAMTRHSFVYVYSRDFAAAEPMLDLASGIARKGDRALSTRQWVSAVRAQALAGLRDLKGCQRALDAAGEVQGMSGQVHNGGWLRFDGTRLPEERGACYAELGRPGLAAACLQEALSGALSARRRGSVHTDLARIGLLRHDLSAFAAHAGAALDLAGETGSGYVARRLRDLLPLLGPQADSTVRQMRNRISSLHGTEEE